MLNRLELIGFKSFSDKTTIDFPKGITVIVGPNGSGKSNIIDALRWLLGEREAKNLRGATADSLIFGGTKRKSPVGMAQASVYFDNSQKIIPIDFKEVVITRRLYRDGRSEFAINKSQVRLKDIIDLFAQSKMGTKGFSIINQGNSDAFIKASPVERRDMMEEILGLRQYQIKKHDANLKLKATKANLITTTVTIEELLPHLRLLRRQAGKWEKRAAYEAELKELETQYFTRQISQLNQESSQIETALNKINQTINDANQELTRLEEKLKQVENSDVVAHRSNHNPEKSNLQKELALLQARLQLLKPTPKTKAATADLARLIADIQSSFTALYKKTTVLEIIAGLKELEKQINQTLNQGAVANDDNFLRQQSQINLEIKNLSHKISAIEAIEQKNLKDLEDFNQVFKRAFAAVTDQKDTLRRLAHDRDQILLAKDRWLYQWQDLEGRLKEAGHQARDFANIRLARADFNFTETYSKIIKLRQELALIGEIDPELVKEARETEERYNFLESQTKDLNQAVVDLEKLVTDLDFKIHNDFNTALKLVNDEFGHYFKAMFGEGRARLLAASSKKDETEAADGAIGPSLNKAIEIEIAIPAKGIKSLESLSGGEKSLVALAVLFALISISPPPFLVFDEVDAALDERNSRRFVDLLRQLAVKTQFAIVTHNRSVMEAANALYGITMSEEGTSKILSLKLS